MFHVATLVHHYGYAAVFIILAVEMIGVPFPAETSLTFFGVEWGRGTLSFLPLFLSAWSGNVIGSLIAYTIGRTFGHAILTRYGKYVGMTETRLNRANEAYAKYRVILVLCSRFVSGLRVLVPYLTGLNEMSIVSFLFYTVVSAAVWVTVFLLEGRYLGAAWSRYHRWLGPHPVIVALVAVGLIILVAVIIRVRRRLSGARRGR